MFTCSSRQPSCLARARLSPVSGVGLHRGRCFPGLGSLAACSNDWDMRQCSHMSLQGGTGWVFLGQLPGPGKAMWALPRSINLCTAPMPTCCGMCDAPAGVNRSATAMTSMATDMHHELAIIR